MKRNRIITLLTLMLVIVAVSCKKDKDVLDTNSNDLPPNKMEVSEIEGIVGYWGEINKYTVNVSIPGTHDSQIIGIVDDLPTNFRTEGMMVVFSGLYEESILNPEPVLGGQSVYSLTLSSINMK